MSTRDCSDEDNDAMNDFRGSKTSLGSGMKRWLTEENLSSDGGSREGKMDILDGPLHGSHSNSTGTYDFPVISLVVNKSILLSSFRF